MTLVFLSCVRVRKKKKKTASSDLCSVLFFMNLTCQILNCHGFVLVVKICLNVSVPYIFIYIKDMNIFISALSGRSVDSIGKCNFFFFSLLH